MFNKDAFKENVIETVATCKVINKFLLSKYVLKERTTFDEFLKVTKIKKDHAKYYLGIWVNAVRNNRDQSGGTDLLCIFFNDQHKKPDWLDDLNLTSNERSHIRTASLNLNFNDDFFRAIFANYLTANGHETELVKEQLHIAANLALTALKETGLIHLDEASIPPENLSLIRGNIGPAGCYVFPGTSIYRYGKMSLNITWGLQNYEIKGTIIDRNYKPTFAVVTKEGEAAEETIYRLQVKEMIQSSTDKLLKQGFIFNGLRKFNSTGGHVTVSFIKDDDIHSEIYLTFHDVKHNVVLV